VADEVAGRIMPGPRRLDQLVTDKQIEDVIRKHALGQEIWWQRTWAAIQQPVVNPETGDVETNTLPITTIVLGMRGHLIGPENYIWWFVNIDAYPTKDKVEKYIEEALEGMRQRKARQLNGTGPFKG